MKYILRLIVSPFVLIISLIPNIYFSFKVFVLFIRYGGEFITYTKSDKVTIYDIYKNLKLKNNEKI